ncbi:MAG: hypothetical protein DRN04_16510, partial [Thermoprotei archaeon]
MAGGDISINSESAKTFKNRFMELKLKEIGPFTFKHLTIKSAKSIIIENSAGGKTTIARVLNAFLSGRVDRALLKVQERNKRKVDKGSAELVFNGRKYRLEITFDSDRVDKIFDAEYAEYLVLTENTPLYGIYVSPDRMSLDFLVSKFVPEPVELKRLEGEMYRLEKEAIDYDNMAKGYEDTAKKYEKDLNKVEEELKKIEEQLAKWKEYENIKVINKKKEKERELKNIVKLVNEYRQEQEELTKKLGGTNYDDLKVRRKEVADELGSLYTMRKLYEETKEALQGLKTYLEKIEDKIDILYDLNIPLFGGFPDAETIRTYINDLEVALEAVVSKYAETSQKIKELEKELDRLDRTIREYVSAYERLQQLEVEIERLERRKRDLENEIAYLNRKVQEILQKEGGTEDELIKRYASLEDINKLMARKNELLKEKEKLKTYIKSFREAAEKARRQKEQNKEINRKYEEIKRKYNSLNYKWKKERKTFKETFKEAFREAFKNISIPDFDPEE